MLIHSRDSILISQQLVSWEKLKPLGSRQSDSEFALTHAAILEKLPNHCSSLSVHILTSPHGIYTNTMATCMHCCQVMNGRPLQGMTAATPFFPSVLVIPSKKFAPCHSPLQGSRYFEFWWWGWVLAIEFYVFLLLQCSNIWGKTVTSDFGDAVRVKSVTALATISWQRLCRCRGTQWSTLHSCWLKDVLVTGTVVLHSNPFCSVSCDRLAVCDYRWWWVSTRPRNLARPKHILVDARSVTTRLCSCHARVPLSTHACMERALIKSRVI